MKIYKLNCLVYAHKYKSMEQVAPGKGKREGFWEGKNNTLKLSVLAQTVLLKLSYS